MLYTGDALAALHTQLVLRFRSMAARHRPGCAFVAPYPTGQDFSPSEILVIPNHSEAALFSIGFLQGDRTTMVVRIGEHGVLNFIEDGHSTRSLAATAKLLFDVALSGRYREETWIHCPSGRYEGGQSFFIDETLDWQELGGCDRVVSPLSCPGSTTRCWIAGTSRTEPSPACVDALGTVERHGAVKRFQ